jgi:hypothetical protein
MLYSKTVAFDIIMTDDLDWKQQQEEQVEQQQQQQQHEQQQQEEKQQHHEFQEDIPYPHPHAATGTGTDLTGTTEDTSRLLTPDTSEHHHTEDHKYSGDVSTNVKANNNNNNGVSYNDQDDFQPPTDLEEWTVYHNDDGQAYFYNNYTNECQWEMPPGFVASEESLMEQPPPVEEDEGDAMADAMLKLSRGFKAGQISAEQRQQFMTDIIECRDLGEVHRDINEILDKWEEGS